MLTDLSHGKLAEAQHLFLTTSGRTGRTTVELWFACHHNTIYVLSSRGEAADWVRNIGRNPQVDLQIGRTLRTGRARRITNLEEDVRARRLVVCKYQQSSSTAWGRTALPIAIDLD